MWNCAFSSSVCFSFSVYSGHQSILVPPLELESNASLWLAAVSQYKVRVTFCSYSVMEMCTKGLGSQTEALRVSLSFHLLNGVSSINSVPFCAVATVRIMETTLLIKLFCYFSPCPVEKCEPVLCAHVHGGSRGEAQNNTHSVLLEDLQRPGALATRRQHHLWLQGECGDLFAGKQLLKHVEEEEEGRGGEVWWRALCIIFLLNMILSSHLNWLNFGASSSSVSPNLMKISS